MIENLLKIPGKKTHVVWRFFLQIKCVDMSKSINISKGRQPWLFQFEVYTPYKNGFGISLMFTRQTGMIRILKITLW